MCPMRTPDQDERPDPGSVGESLGEGFGSVDPGDIHDGYGAGDFYPEYGDSYDEPVDPDDTYDTDDTFDDAADDDGGFGSDDGVTVDGDGTGLGEVVPVGSEVSDAEAENILEEILDDIFGDDADDVVADMEASSGMDASEILESLDDAYVDEDGLGGSDITDGGGVLDNPVDGSADGMDAADFVSESDFDLNTDGHVDQGDLHEAAHPFDFHVDGGG